MRDATKETRTSFVSDETLGASPLKLSYVVAQLPPWPMPPAAIYARSAPAVSPITAYAWAASPVVAAYARPAPVASPAASYARATSSADAARRRPAPLHRLRPADARPLDPLDPAGGPSTVRASSNYFGIVVIIEI
jgi:hypothetical protein